MVKIICVRLEVCHANTDGSAWYAYFEGQEPTPEDIEEARTSHTARETCGLGLEADGPEEVPNTLSEYAGLRRYYVGYAS